MKGGFAVDWNKLKAEYIAGGTSYRKLANKYSVSFRALADRAKAEDWVGLKSQIQHNTDTKVIDQISQNQAESATIISDTTLKLLRNMADDVVKKKLNSAQAAFYKDAADALRKFRDVVGIKSPKDAEEQEARILNLRRQAQADKTDNSDLTVELGEAEEYAI